MKIILLLIFTTFFYNCYSQYVKEDENIIRFLAAFNNRTYFRGGEQEKIFYYSNKQVIDRLNNDIAELPIDRCKNEKIEILVFVDSLGYNSEILLSYGTGLNKLDSAIVEKVKCLQGHWIPAIKEDKKINYLATLTFLLFNSHHVTRTTRTETKSLSLQDKSYTIQVKQVKQFDHEKNCKDSEFYYNKGLEAFNNTKYKKAADYFSKTLIINPYHVDALYNLSVSYLKQNKMEKACRSFEKAFNYGDDASGEIVYKLCKK